MYHITTRFIADREYFFYPNQAFTFSWIVKKIGRILTKNIEKSEAIFLFVCEIAYIICAIYTANIGIFAAESLLFLLMLSACVMDIKTMSIDKYLSLTIPVVVVLLNLLSKEKFSIASYCITFGYLALFYVIAKIGKYIYKKDIIGGADVDSVLGIAIYFSYLYFLTFVIIACILGIFTKLVLNAQNYKNKMTQNFPFLPGICSAFYITRWIGGWNFSFFNGIFYYI